MFSSGHCHSDALNLSVPEYALEGTVNGAGAAMRWAESEWGINDIESVSWQNVEEVTIFLNSVGGLGSPFWRSDVIPRFLDVSKSHNDYTKEQCMAALMESIVFLLTINIEEMLKHGVVTNQLLVAGGMSKDVYLCQCLANLSSASVVASNFKEATSRGAAWLAMQRPDWDVLERKQFYPVKDNALQFRYREFKSAMQGLVH